METVEHALPPPRDRGTGFLPRLLWPIAATIGLLIVVLAPVAAVLQSTSIGDPARDVVLQAVTSATILGTALLVWRNVPAHERRLAVAAKGPKRRAIGMGAAIGLGLIVAVTALLSVAAIFDDGLEGRFEEAQRLEPDRVPWRIVLIVLALVVLAPLGEELLFRGLILRALARRLSFWPSAAIASLLFAAAHGDSYLIWARLPSLFAVGLVLAWLYRARGYPASVAAHAAFNSISAIVLAAQS